MSLGRPPRAYGFVLRCDDCGKTAALRTDTSLEGMALAGRAGWHLTAKTKGHPAHDRCPRCALAAAAVAKKPTRRPKATAARRSAPSSTR
jgi:hypothetical protein